MSNKGLLSGSLVNSPHALEMARDDPLAGGRGRRGGRWAPALRPGGPVQAVLRLVLVLGAPGVDLGRWAARPRVTPAPARTSLCLSVPICTPPGFPPPWSLSGFPAGLDGRPPRPSRPNIPRLFLPPEALA